MKSCSIWLYELLNLYDGSLCLVCMLELLSLLSCCKLAVKFGVCRLGFGVVCTKTLGGDHCTYTRVHCCAINCLYVSMQESALVAITQGGYLSHGVEGTLLAVCNNCSCRPNRRGRHAPSRVWGFYSKYTDLFALSFNFSNGCLLAYVGSYSSSCFETTHQKKSA